MKFKCLILDHDDTVVNSTKTIHYPSFVAYMNEFKGGTKYTLDDYFVLNFDPGVLGFFKDYCGLSDEEMKQEEQYWRNYVKNYVPKAYDGIADILKRYVSEGGLICVVSHSFSENILRDYRENDLPTPDAVYGWELPRELRKPNPYAIETFMKDHDLTPSDLLVVDDLKPGYEMARAAGVTFAAAGWANDLAPIENFMRQNCDVYLKTVEDFRDYLFSDVDFTVK